MDIRKIKKLVEILQESDLSEIEIEENEERVRLARLPGNRPVPAYEPPVVTHTPGGEKDKSEEPSDPDLKEGHVIRAPMVGTFYAAPNPESEPFVRTNQEVHAGDVVCIIEAMKMFNQIESDWDGKLVSVLVENGQPVEFDQPLFILR